MSLTELAFRMTRVLRQRYPTVPIGDLASFARSLPAAEIEDIRSAARWSDE